MTLARPMPKPEKRKAASLAIMVEVFLRQGVPCAKCPAILKLEGFEMDHIQPLDALGRQTPDNWQALCPACHLVKTRIDNARAKKGARVRGETGQLKRRREAGPTFTSRNDLALRPSRGFDKTLTRGFDGKVRNREARS